MMSTRPELEALAQAGLAVAAGPTQQYLTFALGNESYAAAISAIREILEVPNLTAVPLVPPLVRGVINLRGAVVPVVDLAKRLELGHTKISRRTCVVVVEVRGDGGAEEPREAHGADDIQLIGVLVEAVHEVLDVAAAQIEPAPGLGTRIHPEFIQGMARVNGSLLVVLDFARVLAQRELASLIANHRLAPEALLHPVP